MIRSIVLHWTAAYYLLPCNELLLYEYCIVLCCIRIAWYCGVLILVKFVMDLPLRLPPQWREVPTNQRTQTNKPTNQTIININARTNTDQSTPTNISPVNQKNQSKSTHKQKDQWMNPDKINQPIKSIHEPLEPVGVLLQFLAFRAFLARLASTLPRDPGQVLVNRRAQWPRIRNKKKYRVLGVHERAHMIWYNAWFSNPQRLQYYY